MTARLIAGHARDGEAGSGGHRSLAVAEVQQALRDLQSRPYTAAGHPGGDTSAGTRDQRGDTSTVKARTGGDRHLHRLSWVTVRAAHSGAGASTVALAICDAAGATGAAAHLIDDALTPLSGLVAAASNEQGVDDSGTWRRGVRGSVTIDRNATTRAPSGWPPPTDERAYVTVLDLGLGDPRPSPGDYRAVTVVVCRPTVPGVRLTEHLLDRLDEQSAVIAAVGLTRWSGEVAASLGPRLSAVREAGRVVPVPIDRRLEVSGLTSRPLPSSLMAASTALLEVLGATPSSVRNRDGAR